MSYLGAPSGSAQGIESIPKHQLITLQHAGCPRNASRLHTLLQTGLDHQQGWRTDVGWRGRKLGEELHGSLRQTIALTQGLRYTATIGPPGGKVHRQGRHDFRLTTIEAQPGQVSAVCLGPESGFIRVAVGR